MGTGNQQLNSHQALATELLKKFPTSGAQICALFFWWQAKRLGHEKAVKEISRKVVKIYLCIYLFDSVLRRICQLYNGCQHFCGRKPSSALGKPTTNRRLLEHFLRTSEKSGNKQHLKWPTGRSVCGKAGSFKRLTRLRPGGGTRLKPMRVTTETCTYRSCKNNSMAENISKTIRSIASSVCDSRFYCHIDVFPFCPARDIQCPLWFKEMHWSY